MKHTILAAVIGAFVAHQVLAETLPMPVEKLGEVQGVPFYKGYGSSIDADTQNPKRFYGLTDRGPNADGGEHIKIFLQPSFTPSIGHFEIQANGTIKKLRDIPLKDKNGKPMPIIPGMVATVDIKTGEKTIFQYLIKPITRMKQALSER